MREKMIGSKKYYKCGRSRVVRLNSNRVILVEECTGTHSASMRHVINKLLQASNDHMEETMRRLGKGCSSNVRAGALQRAVDDKTLPACMGPL
jgi:hypothetical protein